MLDSHCHLDRYADPQSVARDAVAAGAFVVAVTNLPSHFDLGRPHVARMKRIRLALGLHPLAADRHASEIHRFDVLYPTTSFIGEIGLDFSREGVGTAERQLLTFRHVAQHLARTPKFVTVHSRGAEGELLATLTEYQVSPVVFHWYTGPLGILDEALSAGHSFSINPAMIESDKGRRTIARIPKERVLTESDGPFAKVGGRPAAPQDVQKVEAYLAREWGSAELDVRAVVWRNFRALVPRRAL